MKYTLLLLFLLCCVARPQAQSDAKASILADQVLEAAGGQQAWDNTQYLQWNFFGRRMWWWDKWTGNIRMESQNSDLRIAMNINEKQGRVFLHGIEQTNRDSLDKYLDLGYRMWVNDSYWLVMPFKLKDPGVVLRDKGLQQDLDGKGCHTIELTFSEVGVTPENKYLIYIDPESKLIVQWDYFRNHADQEPQFQSQWKDYKMYGSIKLSGTRGERNIPDIAVHKSLPPFLFVNVLKPASVLLRQ